MPLDVVSGCEDQEVHNAVCLMEQYQMRRLPVLNHCQQLVGMVALGDLAVQVGTQLIATAVLEQVSAPGTLRRHSPRLPGSKPWRGRFQAWEDGRRR